MSASIRKRMELAGPLWKAMASRFDSLVAKVNELQAQVFVGQNPHKVNDVTNVLTLSAAGSQDDCIDLVQQIITKYEAHIGGTTWHVGADSTNVVTELGVPTEIYTLLNEIKTDYEAHRVLTAGSVHAGTDAVNTITSSNATTKALAVTLANELVADLQLNFADVSSHHGGSGDTAGAATLAALGVLTALSTWAQISAVADSLRTVYEAHRVLTAGAVHGLADSTNSVTAAAVGTFDTAVYAGINELKADVNAHYGDGTSYHFTRDVSMVVAAANATTLPTLQALAKEIRDSYNDHITQATEYVLIPTLDQTV